MSDWTTQAADVIENTVGAVRDKTVEPATLVVRGIVFGLLAAFLLIPALILVAILIVRIVDIAVPSHPWLPYGIVSVVTLLIGAWCMGRRNART